jgi:dTDP-4-dehydrorhamnose 3,5-epimerase
MIFHATEIEGLVVIETKKFSDERGYFFESFHQEKFEAYIARKVSFLQENESLSKKNVVRGLHFQKPPFAQGKLVRVPYGKVLDIAVDIRKNSTTYGAVFQIELSQDNGKQLWIPEGFAHGFASLEENSLLSYKCTNYYNKESEDALQWNDKALSIDWGIINPIVSEKDSIAQSFTTFNTPF